MLSESTVLSFKALVNFRFENYYDAGQVGKIIHGRPELVEYRLIHFFLHILNGNIYFLYLFHAMHETRPHLGRVPSNG